MMMFDLTDWAALLEALDGKTAPPPSLPPLPEIATGPAAPFVLATDAPRRRRPVRHRPPCAPCPPMPRSQ
ncbi:hypothetical protein [Magnetospirillum sp. SS-4]|uniref:hypothetical protein n=1 Tax=Magnetospirillum sp. SS-4 TaxID=2681465 RepID=UPI001572DF13|nr:hypothetical protein [Magnetospirillum sp. SS-4]